MGIIQINDHECWLQARGVNSFDDELKATLSSIAAKESGIIGSNAVSELQFGLKSRFGIDSALTEDFAAAAGAPGIVMGVAATLEGKSIKIPQLKAEGFEIKTTGKSITIIGADECGLLYGVYRFLEELALGDKGPFDINDAPAGKIRMLNHWDNLRPLIPGMRTTEGTEYRGGPLFFYKETIDFDPAQIKEYARLLASVGINRTTISNVNVFNDEKLFITEKYLPKIAGITEILRPFGIRLVISVFFAMTKQFSDIGNSDPLDERVLDWWKKQTDIVYSFIPDLAGYIVKADSEGEPGPFEYGRTHADGANMLARALKPHGGDVFWRCFVYNCTQDWRDQSIDRPKSCYDIFKPLDGQFDDNVILQIKNGPLDFQPYEPVNPLFGAMSKTRCIMEAQVVKEYTGGHTYATFLPYFWATEVMSFDMGYGEKSTIADMISDGRLDGVTAVSNLYNVRNWTGHMLDQANIYGYGKLCWNPRLTPKKIADDWTKLTFGDESACETVSRILMDSYPAMAKNNNPFGVSFMCSTRTHYGPDIEGYEFSRWGTYHRSNREGIGVDRTANGTGYTSQYTPKVAKLLSDPATCPENFILFIHRLRYDYIMKNGKSLLQNIYDNHFDGYEESEAMAKAWDSLEGKISGDVYKSVADRFVLQLETSREWRDQINTYFRRFTGIDDEKGRKIYD